jgi:cellulose synthase operon protein C
VKAVRTVKLWFREGAADQVYEVDLVDTEAQAPDARFLVNIRYGRRGQVLREGTKTPVPIARATAEKIFDSVIVSKVNDGYRRSDGAEPHAPAPNPGAAELPGGRERALTLQLEACLRAPWPERKRDRLFWRAGEVRLREAVPLLLQLADKIGFAQASYSLVWALARCAGGDAVAVLTAIAAETQAPLVRGLAQFALVSPLMGESRSAPQQNTPLPESIVRALAGGGGETDSEPSPDLALPEPMRRPVAAHLQRLDALYGAFTDFARREPAWAGSLLAELYRLAQADLALYGLLVAMVQRLPARPPYVPGLRRLFKYAEMLDDGPMFGAAARCFEMAEPMYKQQFRYADNAVPRALVQEVDRSRWAPLKHLAGAPDANTALSRNTVHYLKRRIWRALRKRGELGQQSYLELATAYLLAFSKTDLTKPLTLRFYRWNWETRQRIVLTQNYGPLATAWSAGQLLYRHAPEVRLRHGSLTHFFTAEASTNARGEAFPTLWDAHPDYALRLASESRCEPIALFGLRILRAQPSYLRGLPSTALELLLASPFTEIVELAFDEARTRLAQGAFDDTLIAALLAAGLPDVRELAIRRIDLDPSLPWASPRLAFIAVTSEHGDVQTAAAKWCAERALPADAGGVLAKQLAAWLLTSPAESRIRHLRACLPYLWPGHDLPLSPEIIERLMAHPAVAVAAAGVAMLALSGADASSLSDTLWQKLLNSPEPEIQAAALGLLGRLSDEKLSERAFLIAAMATASASEVRRAARPLIRRLAIRLPRLGNELAARLIDTLFQSASDDSYGDDIVALFREALPDQLASLDANLVWRLLQAKAKGAQLLGAAAVTMREPQVYSVRQLARLGNHSHAAVRAWVMAAYEAQPNRVRTEAEDAVLLIESDWQDAQDFALRVFDRWPDEVWTPNVLAVVADSTNPKILAYARSVLRRTMRPGDAARQLTRLLEHPAASMHLLVSEVLTDDAAKDETVFAKLLPLSRIILLQIHKGRVAKDRIGSFLHAQALKSRDRAAAIAPLFVDVSLSAIERDRARAVLALRDIEEAFPGLIAAAPLKCVPLALRSA